DASVAPRDVVHKRAIPQPPEVGGRSERAGMQAARASREALRSTLAVGDGQREAMTVPRSWAHARRQTPDSPPANGSNNETSRGGQQSRLHSAQANETQFSTPPSSPRVVIR